MTVQGPVKKQQPDGMSHGGALAVWCCAGDWKTARSACPQAVPAIVYRPPGHGHPPQLTAASVVGEGGRWICAGSSSANPHRRAGPGSPWNAVALPNPLPGGTSMGVWVVFEGSGRGVGVGGICVAPHRPGAVRHTPFAHGRSAQWQALRMSV